jgi:hypothetical protein
MERRADSSSIDTIPPMGQKAHSRKVAFNLARRYTFEQIRGPLLFFVIDWNGQNIERYGRTLQTFVKSLPLIEEAYEDSVRAERDYVRQTMVRYGLDREFPTPEKVSRAQIAEQSAAEKQAWEKWNARFAA